MLLFGRPQGAYHNVVRWVHRSSFTIRPGRGRTPNSRPSSRPSSRAGSRPTPNSIMQIGNSSRIHIPDTDGLCVDPGWYGTVIVETEGTNEALADLQDRCGPGAFPPRATPTHERFTPTKDKEAKRIFRILRERRLVSISMLSSPLLKYCLSIVALEKYGSGRSALKNDCCKPRTLDM